MLNKPVYKLPPTVEMAGNPETLILKSRNP